MVKRIFVLWKPPEVSAEAFGCRLITEQVPELLRLDPAGLTVNVADVEPDAEGLARGDGATVAGLVSVYADEADRGDAYAGILDPSDRYIAGYTVTETVPLAYDRRWWPDGEATPGAKQVTLLRRRADLSRGAFLRHWREVHTPLALEIYPVWGCRENVVEEEVTDSAPPYDGVIELMVREVEDLTDPMRFFGSRENIERVLDDLKQWLDFDAIEYYSMREIIIKSEEAG